MTGLRRAATSSQEIEFRLDRVSPYHPRVAHYSACHFTVANAFRKEFVYGMNAVIADSRVPEPDLMSRLQVRARQLQDAYDTFHDAALSDAQAEEVLKQVFPEIGSAVLMPASQAI